MVALAGDGEGSRVGRLRAAVDRVVRGRDAGGADVGGGERHGHGRVGPAAVVVGLEAGGGGGRSARVGA